MGSNYNADNAQDVKATKFGHLIEHNVRIIFLQDSCTREVKASDVNQGSTNFECP